jgi:uncharacterized protein YjiS (DUF1127 family)
MPQSRDAHARNWFGTAGASVSDLVCRLITALDDWRERERLRSELAGLANTGELDGVLQEVGLSRGEIPVLLAGRPGAAHRMDEMMRRLGLDRAALSASGELRDAEWRCMRCPAWRRCRSWLAAEPLANDVPFFCPNLPSFELARAKKTSTADPAWAGFAGAGPAGRGCGGILAELDSIKGQLL